MVRPRHVVFIFVLVGFSSPVFARPPATKTARRNVSKEPPAFNLSKVAGMDLYTGPEEGKAVLAREGLVITSETKQRLFQLYQTPDDPETIRRVMRRAMKADWDSPDVARKTFLPCFVTTDTAVRALFEVFEEGFEKLEVRQADLLKEMLGRLWTGLAVGRFFEKGVEIEGASRLGAATIAAVGIRLTDPKWEPKTAAGKAIYEEIRKDVEAELKRVRAERVVQASPLFMRDIDYSLCKPRSFYAGKPKLERFYRARTFLGFPMNLDDDRILRAGLALGCFPDSEEFMQPYERMLGHPNILPAHRLVPGDYGQWMGEESKQRVREHLGGKNLTELRRSLREQAQARGLYIISGSAGEFLEDVEKPPLLGAFLPKTAVPDSIMMSECIWPKLARRLIPTGLDVLACCGNDRATSLAVATTPESTRRALAERIAFVRENFVPFLGHSGPDPCLTRYAGSLFVMWGRIFRELSHPNITVRHPKFMSSKAYADKSLNTAMSGWAGYRHTVQLQAEDLSSLFGGPPLPPPGYVEPNLGFWDAMVDATLVLQEMLGEHDAAIGRMASLTRMCLMAGQVARAQLAGKQLTEEQVEWLGDFEEVMAGVCGSRFTLFALDASSISTVASDRLANRALHVGLARPRAIYVIVDYGGKLQLARGGVMSYREFWRPLAKGRLTDQEWRKIISEGKAPGPPAWIAPIVVGRVLSDKEMGEQRERALRGLGREAEKELKESPSDRQ